jgi:hypothetical protein
MVAATENTIMSGEKARRPVFQFDQIVTLSTF